MTTAIKGIRVGRLAERTGLSVRTLHWYDEIGLLRPSHRTEAGHRLYTGDDVVRLQRIISLRALDFSLEEIAGSLDDPAFDHVAVIRAHRQRLRKEQERAAALCERLKRLEESLLAGASTSTDDIIHIIEGITMIEKYYSEEQLAELKKRADEMGEEGMLAAQNEWAELIAAVKSEMEKGSDPRSTEVRELARRWNALIARFTGGNPEIAASLKSMYENEGAQSASRGMVDPEMMAFISEGNGD